MSEFRGSNVTGVGVVSPAGLGSRALFDACVAGKTTLQFDDRYNLNTGRISDATERAMRDAIIASPWRDVFADELQREHWAARPWLLTSYALMQALAGEGPEALEGDTGLIFATTTGHIHRWEEDLPRYVAKELTTEEFAPSFRDHHLGRALDAVIHRTGFRGPFQVISSACAAGTQALALAHSWLATGKVQRVLVGATEILTTLTMRGFGCFNLLTPGIAAPFDRNRSGINLSEAAVFLRLDGDASLPGHGFVLGGGTGMDAFDMTRPHPEGRGIYKVMTDALASAKCAPRDVDWVYAHGTGTPANDTAEAAAISMLFGEHRPIVSSTKAIHGHALGAAGLLETTLALEALAQGIVLPTTNLTELDETIRVDVATTARKVPLRRVMKTTLGFGGVNAAVLLGSASSFPGPKGRRESPRDAQRPLRGLGMTKKGEVHLIAGAIARPEFIEALADRAEFRKATRPMLLACEAIETALKSLPASVQATQPAWGIVVGVDHGELEVTKEFLCTLRTRNMARPFLFQNSLHNATLGFLSMHLGLTGPGATTTTGFFGGEDALDLAADYVRSGAAPVCLAIGTEALDDEMVPAAQHLLGERATCSNGAAVVVVASETFVKEHGLAHRPQYLGVQCERAPVACRIPTSPLLEFYGSNAIATLVTRLNAETEIESLKPDGARSVIRLAGPREC